jgi:hypothetical protein
MRMERDLNRQGAKVAKGARRRMILNVGFWILNGRGLNREWTRINANWRGAMGRAAPPGPLVKEG